MNEQRYNGHANYETWATCLWLDNDEGSYRHWRETARDILRRQPPSEEGLHQARIAFAKELQESVTDAAPLDAANLYTDLLRAAISEIDWFEIAEGMIDEMQSE